MLHVALTLTLFLFALPAVSIAADVSVAGQVLGPDGEPRAKVGVHLESILPTYERARLRLEGKPGPEPVARTRTGSDGMFDLAAPEAGMWKVVVSAPGALAMELRLVPLVEATDLPPVTLTPAADLEVRLIDAEGKPRPGAVGAVPLGVGRNAWRPTLRLARAGADGVASLPLGQDEKIQLEVLGDGHPLAVFELFDETSVTIDLPAGVARKVRITDPRKRPLAEAIAFQGSALLPLGLSDSEGHLHLVLQTQKTPSVRVSTADRWNGSFGLDPGKAGVEDLPLEPPGILRGRVLNLQNRDPVSGALAWAVRGEFAVTDEQGRYALEVGVYKSRMVQAAAAGYQRGHSQLGDTATEDPPPIALAPSAGVSGKVVDREGALLAGVKIELSPMPHSGRISQAAHRVMRSGWQGRTSDRGAFRVTGVPAGLGYRLTFKRPGFAPSTLDVEPLEPFENRSGLKVVLEPGRLAIGRVVDEDDVPIAGAEIGLKAPPPTDDPMATVRMARWNRDPTDAPTYLTDAEGRFEIADLAAGQYDLSVRATGFAPARVPGVRVPEVEGRADFGTVVLIRGASIEGRVTDPDGAPIADVEVTVETVGQGFGVGHTSSEIAEANKTDKQGRFVVPDLLPDQPVTLFASKTGYGGKAMASLRPPLDEPLAIVLELAARIKGRVVDKQGDPVQRASVNVNPDHRVMTSAQMMRQRGRATWARTGPDGAFLIEDVQPGAQQVTVDAEGYQQQVRSGIEVAAGSELELELVLEAGAVVEGTVTTAAGEPVAQASINVTEPIEGFTGGNLISAHGQTDFEGRYRIVGAPTGPARISVHRNSGQQMEKSIEVKPGNNVVDLVLERGFEITGQVVAPDGAPMAGANLSIQQITQPGAVHFSFGNQPQARSASDGRFALTGIKAGKYKVSASREGYAPALSEELDVAGDVTGLLLELSTGGTLKGRVLGLEFDELGVLTLVAYSQHGGMRQGRVDFEGEYAFTSLAPGQWHVQAQVPSSGRSTSLQVDVPEGVPEVLKDIEFGTGFTLTGIVLDGGEPLAGANVTASSMSGSAGFGASGGDGRFRIEGLKAGAYQVMVMAGVGMHHIETFDLVGDHELRIELATGSVSGLVRDAAGEPLPGALVVLEQLDASSLAQQFGFGNRAESDSRGAFNVPRVRQGTWRVVATRAGYAPGETTVAVAGGGAPEVEIRLTPTEGVTFQVALESGLAVSSLLVAILDPTGRPLTSGSHQVIDGKVRVSTVPPGRWVLVVQGGDGAATRFVVNAPGDQGSFLLRTAGTLHIKVPELEQVPMASVKLTGPDGQPFLSPTGLSFGPGEWLAAGGQAMVPSLVPGVWSFTVSHEDRTWSGSATVTAGATTEVSVP